MLLLVAAVSPGVIASSSMENLHSAIHAPMPAFTEPHQSSIIANNLPSLARVTSNGKQFGLNESNHSLDEVKFGNQHPGFHPHSLPEYHDGFMEGLENRHVRGMGSNGHLREPNGGGKCSYLKCLFRRGTDFFDSLLGMLNQIYYHFIKIGIIYFWNGNGVPVCAIII